MWSKSGMNFVFLEEFFIFIDKDDYFYFWFLFFVGMLECDLFIFVIVRFQEFSLVFVVV